MTSRREFLASTLALGAMTGLSPASSVQTPGLPSLKGRKVLFTYGGWDGHEPEKFSAFISTWLKGEGAEVLLHSTLEPYADKSLMDTVDLVVQIFTMATITKEQEAGLLEAVEKKGTGMAGWHGGMCDAFRQNEAYRYMTGGLWVAHPGGYVDYEVNITDHKDAVTQGLHDFAMKSEQYYMHVDPNVKVLATTRFNGQTNAWIDGCVMPVTWKKMHGKGRIFYTSVGHNLSHIIDKPDAMEMLKRGIRWAGASKYEPAEKWVNPVYARLK